MQNDYRILNGLDTNNHRFILCPHPNLAVETIKLFKKFLKKFIF